MYYVVVVICWLFFCDYLQLLLFTIVYVCVNVEDQKTCFFDVASLFLFLFLYFYYYYYYCTTRTIPLLRLSCFSSLTSCVVYECMCVCVLYVTSNSYVCVNNIVFVLMMKDPILLLLLLLFLFVIIIIMILIVVVLSCYVG